MRAAPAAAVLAGVALLVGGLGAAASSSTAQVRQVQALQGESELLADGLSDSFERARGLTLLLAHYQRVAGAAAGTDSARRDAEDAISYLEQLYPGWIDDVRVIDQGGRELARVTNGIAAPPEQLRPDESRFAFFTGTLALPQGQVYVSAPYVSPDTRSWVVAAATWVPARSGSRRVVLHLELSLAGFRDRLAAGRDARVAVVDDAAGRVLLRPDAPLPGITGTPGPGEPAWDPEVTPEQAWRAFPVARWDGDPPGARRAVEVGAGNVNRWTVVTWPAGDHAVLPVWAGAATAAVGLLLLLLALAMHRRREAAARRAAGRDQLTGLANRAGLTGAAAALGLTGAAAAPGPAAGGRAAGGQVPDGVAVLVLDLDGFKQLNDTHGHVAGDLVLQEVARRLQQRTGTGGVAARLVGDTFAVLLAGVPAADVIARADLLRDTLMRPVGIDGAAHFVGVSVGVAVHPEHGESLEELLRNADSARYRAKRGRGGVRLYDPGTVQGAADLELAAELMTAIDEGAVHLAFQPIHDVRTGEVAGVEALARWERPGAGPVRPDVFVALAERAGLIRGLTRLTLRQALDEVAEWQRRGISLPVSVNLSPYLVTDESLPQQVGEELAARGLSPGSLVLEVTESAAVEADGAAGVVLHRLRSMGVRIELDDFGSGYASYGAMARLPLDGVKLDRTLVTEQAAAEGGPRLLAATVEMAHALGLTVVAEGIEDDAMLATVREIGCDRVQGYLLARPMPPRQLRAWIGCPERVATGS